MDVILSPQRRSFGGGCQGNAALAPHARRPVSPLENKENESLRLGTARRIGSGRIIAARAFEREARAEKERERERDMKEKRYRVGVHFIFPTGLRRRHLLYWDDISTGECCYRILYREILVTNVYSVKGEGMTPMRRRSQSGSLVDPPANLKQLS